MQGKEIRVTASVSYTYWVEDGGPIQSTSDAIEDVMEQLRDHQIPAGEFEFEVEDYS